MKYVRRHDGAEAIADDMPPTARAVALLLEHANARREQGQSLPCHCPECGRHRRTIVYTITADGYLVIEAAP